MRGFCLLLVVGFGGIWLAGVPGKAAGAEAPVEAVLAKWEEASPRWQAVDAKMTVLHNDVVFWSPQTIQTVGEKISQMPERTLWDRFWKGCVSGLAWPARFSQPGDLLPLIGPGNLPSQRRLFDFKVRHGDGRIVLKAVPKQENGHFQEVGVMLDEESHQVLAHQLIHPSGDRTVHLLDDIKINCPPADRDRLKNPVPLGYRVVRVEDLLSAGHDGQPEPAR